MTITIINVVFPRGENQGYTLNYSAQGDNASISSGRVVLSEEEFTAQSAKDYPALVKEKLLKVLGE